MPAWGGVGWESGWVHVWTQKYTCFRRKGRSESTIGTESMIIEKKKPEDEQTKSTLPLIIF